MNYGSYSRGNIRDGNAWRTAIEGSVSLIDERCIAEEQARPQVRNPRMPSIHRQGLFTFVII